MTTKAPVFTVGQEVVISHANFKPRKAIVSKVGRKLVTVGKGGSDDVFRIDDRRTNDAYRHGAIFTVEEWAERCARSDLARDLGEMGIQFHRGVPGWVSTACLREIVEVLSRHRPQKREAP